MEQVARTGALSQSLAIQTRVIGALVMREIITRYGRHNIGFMWIFVEPMMFTTGVISVWSLLHTHSTRMLPLVPFVVTGYSTVLLWRNTIGRCGNAIEPNRALLHHRNVRVIDLFAARLLLEIAGSSISFITLFGILAAIGFMDAPYDALEMMAGWLLLVWFSMAAGLMIGSLSVISETVERVWHVFAYLFLPVSGAFYMVDWLPTHLQWLALLLPTVNCTELLRAGYFGDFVHPHFQIAYVVILNLGLTFASLAAVKGVSTTVEGE